MLVNVWIQPELDKVQVAKRVRAIEGVVSVDDTTPSRSRLVAYIREDDRAVVVEAIKGLSGILDAEEDRPTQLNIMDITQETIDVYRDVFDQPLNFPRWYASRDLDEGRTNPHLRDWQNYPKIGAEFPVNSDRLGANVIVVSIDTGVDNTHPEFVGVPFERIYGGTDLGKHGTYTASIMCGKNIGILPNVKKLIDVKIFNASGGGSTAQRDGGYEALLAWMKDPANPDLDDDTIVIVNCSYGDWLAGYNSILAEIMQEGAVVFAAAGNSAWNLSDGQSEFPASQLTYGAIGATDLSGRVGFFSSYGKDRVWVYAWGYQQLNADSGGTYVYPTGTSMASPYACACFGTWAEGRYRPTNLSEVEALQYEWMTTFCWQEGVFADRGQDIGEDRYVARAAHQILPLQTVADGLEVIAKAGPAPNKANASTLEVIITYDVS